MTVGELPQGKEVLALALVGGGGLHADMFTHNKSGIAMNVSTCNPNMGSVLRQRALRN
jgi:hypothetical protein